MVMEVLETMKKRENQLIRYCLDTCSCLCTCAHKHTHTQNIALHQTRYTAFHESLHISLLLIAKIVVSQTCWQFFSSSGRKQSLKLSSMIAHCRNHLCRGMCIKRGHSLCINKGLLHTQLTCSPNQNVTNPNPSVHGTMK